nr:hypothetical protein [uncultured Psychroserpens sp.]
MNKSITIKDAILINAEKSVVWNFTQDFSKRQTWDKSIIDLNILQLKPFKIIELKSVGGIITKLSYKLCRKPDKTTLKMVDTQSLLIKGGGGSWSYFSVNSKTQWTQVNTLIFKNKLLYILFGWFVKAKLKRITKASMLKAKMIIESNDSQ